jgi:hypothetical protein
MSQISISELICYLCLFFADKSALLPEVFSRQLSTLQNVSDIYSLSLTFKNRASYIQDGRTATLQMLHFIYFFQQL